MRVLTLDPSSPFPNREAMRSAIAVSLMWNSFACSEGDIPGPDAGRRDGAPGTFMDGSTADGGMGAPEPERFLKFQLINEQAAFALTTRGRILGFGPDVERFRASVEIPADHPARQVRLVDLELGSGTNCGRSDDGRVVCWGSFVDGPLVLEPPIDVYAAGTGAMCFIRERPGPIECIGNTDSRFGALSPPPGDFIDVHLDFLMGCGVRTNGRLRCWGPDDPLTREILDRVPDQEEVSFVEANNQVGCAVRTADETLACWGLGAAFSSLAPKEPVVDVRIGGLLGCARLADSDTWRCWDTQTETTLFESDVPSGPLSGLSLEGIRGGSACAVRSSTGDAVCWGDAGLILPEL